VTPLKVLHVGLGSWGEYWVREVYPVLARLGLADVVAAVDVSTERHAIARDVLGLAPEQCFTNVRAALESHPVDFVAVVVPPAFHEAVIEAAIEHRAHVLCEKPIADSLDACCRIARRIDEAGLKMVVTMSHRFDQDKQTLEALIRSGDYGPLNYLVYRFTHNARRFGEWGEFRHRMPDPLLVEGTVHHLDIIRALAGSDAASVYAKTWNPAWGEYAGDSTGLLIAEMTNGVRVLYEGAKANASSMNGWGHDYIRAECRDGTLELDRRQIRVLRGSAWEAPMAEALPLSTARGTWLNPWIAEQFCQWLQGGEAPATTVADNLQCSAFLFAAIESAHEGSPVDVQALLEQSKRTVQ
jgi:predicted dehydrogenase